MQRIIAVLMVLCGGIILWYVPPDFAAPFYPGVLKSIGMIAFLVGCFLTGYQMGYRLARRVSEKAKGP